MRNVQLSDFTSNDSRTSRARQPNALRVRRWQSVLQTAALMAANPSNDSGQHGSSRK